MPERVNRIQQRKRQGEAMGSQKIAFVCLHGSAKSLIAAEYFNRIATGNTDFDIAWTFITGRVEKLISRLSAQWELPQENLVAQ
jgi:hypothetical protein